jgi:hypothetical protein
VATAAGTETVMFCFAASRSRLRPTSSTFARDGLGLTTFRLAPSGAQRFRVRQMQWTSRRTEWRRRRKRHLLIALDTSRQTLEARSDLADYLLAFP